MPCWPVFRAALAVGKAIVKTAAIGVKRSARRHVAARVHHAVVKTIVCAGTGAGLAAAILHAQPGLAWPDPAGQAGKTFLPSVWSSSPADFGTFSFDPKAYSGGAPPYSGGGSANFPMLSATGSGGLEPFLPVSIAALPQDKGVLLRGDGPSDPEIPPDPLKELHPVPEPGSFVLVLTALGFGVVIQRRRAAVSAH